MKILKEDYTNYTLNSETKLSYQEWLEFELIKLREQLSRLKKRKKPEMPNKKIVQQLRAYDLSVIGEYESISDASRRTGISRTSINMHMLNPEKRKQAGGFIWREKK